MIIAETMGTSNPYNYPGWITRDIASAHDSCDNRGKEIARRLVRCFCRVTPLGDVLCDAEEILEMKTRNSKQARLIKVRGARRDSEIKASRTAIKKVLIIT